jgi:hypothetical protein
MTSIKKHCEISIYWTGSAYCGLKIDWDYNNWTVNLSRLGYIKATPNNYHHTACPCSNDMHLTESGE